MNDPINLIDVDGVAPGDKFPSAQEAAIDAIRYINPTSVKEGKEYGGWVHRNKDGTYSYDPPTKGTKDSIHNFPAMSPDDRAWYHTHGSADPGYDNENFSQADKNISDYYNVPGYLGTPGGWIKKYKPSGKTVSTIGTTPKKGQASPCN